MIEISPAWRWTSISIKSTTTEVLQNKTKKSRLQKISFGCLKAQWNKWFNYYSLFSGGRGLEGIEKRMEGNDSEKVDFNPKQNWKRSQSSDRSDFYSVLPAQVGPSITIMPSIMWLVSLREHSLHAESLWYEAFSIHLLFLAAFQRCFYWCGGVVKWSPV